MTMKTPFKLVYGLESMVPMEYLVPSLIIVAFIDMNVFQDKFVSADTDQSP
jgi:hypothetical protein